MPTFSHCILVPSPPPPSCSNVPPILCLTRKVRSALSQDRLIFYISQGKELLRGCGQDPDVILYPLTSLQGTGWAEGILSLLTSVLSGWGKMWQGRAKLVTLFWFLCCIPFVINIAAVSVHFPIPLAFPVNRSYLNL